MNPTPLTAKIGGYAPLRFPSSNSCFRKEKSYENKHNAIREPEDRSDAESR